MSDERCENCRFWDREGPRLEGGVAFGHCRRRSPVLVLGMAALALERWSATPGAIADHEDMREHSATRLWPETFDYDWCGEHQPRAPQ